MTRIERLTPEQIARFPEFVEKWTRIGLCTDPANRPAAEAGVRKAYEIAGLAAPERIVWCGSPLSMGLTRAIVFGLDKAEVQESVKQKVRDSVWASVRDSVWASVGDSVWDSVGDSVWDSVGDSVWDSVGDSVRDSVGDSVWASVRASVGDSVWDSVRDSVWASVGDSVWDSVRDSVWASVGDSVWDSVGDSVWDSVGDSGYGQHDANAHAFYEYFREACELSKETQRLCGLDEIAKNAGWWLPHQKTCWISERNSVLNRNDRGRLHCEDGPALSYPDGWSIYAIDGIRLDEQIVMRPESQTLQQIDGEKNGDIRSIRIERFGWPRYIDECGAVERDYRINSVSNTPEALYRTARGEQCFVVGCSTGRMFGLPVAADISTCEQAQSWLGPQIPGLKLNCIGAT